MKKWAYLLSGVIIGALVATAGSATAAQVKSLIGQKVSGELTVIVNGKELSDKGAVINGKTNAPVRALADSLGAELKLEGKTINITTQNSSSTSSASGESKEDLLVKKEKIEKSIVSLTEEVNKTKEKMEASRIPGTDKYEGEETWKNAIDILESNIRVKNDELKKVNEALKAFE